MANEQLFDALAQRLRDYGLEALFSYDGTGAPGGWLWNVLQEGVDTTEEFEAALEQTDVWRNRFGAIVEQRKQAARGEPVYVMTPNELIQYESEAAQLMRRWGMPSSFYDTRQDLQELVVKGISIDELNERIEQGFATVAALPPVVQDQFGRFYGPSGKAALAAYFMDPERSLKDLERQMAAAQVAGQARLFGLDVGKQAAERLYDTGVSGDEIRQGLQASGQYAPLFRESVGESGQMDLTREREGVAAAIGVDLTTGELTDQAGAQQMLERRLKARQGAFQGGGEAITGRRGIAGAGTAE
jgi:hypothetical protein